MSDDLRIDRVETVLLDIPLRRPHRFARVSMDAQPVLYVFVRTAGGVTGAGEGVVPAGPWWGGESVETMQVIIERYVAPVLLGRQVDDVARLLPRTRRRRSSRPSAQPPHCTSSAPRQVRAGAASFSGPC